MMDSRTCVIIAAMGLAAAEADAIKAMDNAYIICADAGYEHARAAGITPNLILGDFDSYEGEARTIEGTVETFPVEKDDTDTMLAIKEGLAMGCTEFLIYGALGGRLDHTVANMVSLRYLLDHGATGWIISEDNCATMIENTSLKVSFDPHFPNVSVFCYGNTASVSLSGFQYPLSDYPLDQHFPLGVSNHIIGEEALITVKNGAVLVILSA